jgi:hypothetical protein
MLEALPAAEVVHAIPGRTRLRIAARRGDAVFFASIASGLSMIQGVQKVEIRPLTGSILIHHDAPLERIAKAAEQVRLFVLGRAEQVPSPILDVPLAPKMVIGLGLGVLALWQLAQGRVLPRATTLAWYAANLTGLLSDDQKEGGE